jgi:hypothetical protein
MLSNFNLPSVDHLIEGLHYTEVSYDFANKCPKGTWADQQNNGACTNKDLLRNRRKLKQPKGQGQKPMRTRRQKNPTVQGSNFENNKKITTPDGEFGWAMKNGAPTIVKWGSVAGIAKQGGGISHNVAIQQG